MEEWDDSEDDGNENENVEEWRSGNYGGMDFQVDPRYIQKFRKKIGRKGEGYDSDNMLSLPPLPFSSLHCVISHVTQPQRIVDEGKGDDDEEEDDEDNNFSQEIFQKDPELHAEPIGGDSIFQAMQEERLRSLILGSSKKKCNEGLGRVPPNKQKQRKRRRHLLELRGRDDIKLRRRFRKNILFIRYSRNV